LSKEAELNRTSVETAREVGSFATLLAAVESLPADPAKLTTVLTYHVVPGRVTAADAAGLSSAPTVQGDELPISIDGGIHVADASVVSADIEAANGVIHVIDRVLLPAPA
jgi:uncharacterized surface protein with fasciclin (FAS1) repeats